MIPAMGEVKEKCSRPSSSEIDRHHCRVKGKRLNIDGGGRLTSTFEIWQGYGVSNRLIPAIQPSIDPVNLRRVFAVLDMVFGGETFPIKWYIYDVNGQDMNFQAMCVSTQMYSLQITRCF